MHAGPSAHSVNTMTGNTEYVTLRARLGIEVPTDIDSIAFQNHLAAAITNAASDWGAHVDLLQLGVGLNPAWATNGPANRAR